MKQIHFLNNFLLFALPNSKNFFFVVEILCYKTMKSKFFFSLVNRKQNRKPVFLTC